MSTASHLQREIHEQPAVLERLLRSQGPAAAELAQKMTARGITHVVIAARGTSDNAGRYAQYLLGVMNGILVTLAAPSLFTAYQRPPRLGNTLVLGISQSGKSPDVVAVLAEARRQGSLTAVVTNTPNSDLARLGDVVIDLGVGPEKAVAATKTYTAELGALAMLSASLAASGEMKAELDRTPEAMALALGTDRAASEAAAALKEARHMAVLGRGFNYATAFELSLKLTELSYTNAVAHSSADFRHGPLAMVEPGFPVLVLAATGALLEDMRAIVAMLADRRAEVLCISDDASLASTVRLPLTLPRTVPEWLSPLPMIVPGQLLAMHLAALRGYDLDAPRAITKVTETY